jgi:hypothetical protein
MRARRLVLAPRLDLISLAVEVRVGRFTIARRGVRRGARIESTGETKTGLTAVAARTRAAVGSRTGHDDGPRPSVRATLRVAEDRRREDQTRIDRTHSDEADEAARPAIFIGSTRLAVRRRINGHARPYRRFGAGVASLDRRRLAKFVRPAVLIDQTRARGRAPRATADAPTTHAQDQPRSQP